MDKVFWDVYVYCSRINRVLVYNEFDCFSMYKVIVMQLMFFK